jgi:S1-C subfamily serine protease
VNPLDAIALTILVLAVLLGWRSGALPQLAGLAGAAAGAVAGIVLLPAIGPAIENLPGTLRVILILAGLLAFVGAGEALGATLGHRASSALGDGLLGALDRIAGAFVGAGQAVLIVWLLGGVIAGGPFATLAQLAQTSVAIRGVASAFPPPTEIVVQLGNLLDDSGLPDVFLGLEPLPAEGVDLPTDAAARAIGEAASRSVLRVVADACSTRASGTAFVVSVDHLVTNAHVVVGASHVLVQTSQRSYEAVPVFVDLELDVALLYVKGLGAPVLHFTDSEPVRGVPGATFGYPGGGGAVVEPAVVSARYDAVGTDVLGTSKVDRRILQLRATIRPGDSGGPFLLADGSVGGVVFAESKADPTVGYALSPQPVVDAIAGWLAATREVGTGPCIVH